uniref:Uncharacterized protein n=1 Tax=Romanomermis culicivorax TaxID=13658 RepID=A0A915ILQ4_ROMCU
MPAKTTFLCLINFNKSEMAKMSMEHKEEVQTITGRKSASTKAATT